MPARRVRFDLDGVTAVAEMLDDLCPKMAAAFWDALPLETTLSHGKWSGSACFFMPGEGPMRAVKNLEYPVCSIYPGVMVARPGGSELLIAYGASEYRWATGTDYTTPVAKIVENRAEFLGALARMHDDGDKPFAVRREE